ncbi:signal peptidase I [Candidatus Giovannonibacteria bacterium RIFCSPHIGHO2_12_FULL_44_22]|nr:MAG: signal peptidase I [Candidatus Giovannonibacteria bacterium RIFCSPHIGHO2_12_FULL_44_22]
MLKILKFFLNIVIYAAIVGVIVWGLPKYLTKKLGTDYPIAAITSGSMWPALHIGDLVLIQAVSKEDLEVGDIIVWQNDKGFTIHRIAKLNENTLVTKGDGNFTEDAPVKYSDVIGRTVYRDGNPVRIPYMGYISVWSAKIKAN